MKLGCKPGDGIMGLFAPVVICLHYQWNAGPAQLLAFGSIGGPQLQGLLHQRGDTTHPRWPGKACLIHLSKAVGVRSSASLAHNQKHEFLSLLLAMKL